MCESFGLVGGGEILLQSISNDGCGYGLDLSILNFTFLTLKIILLSFSRNFGRPTGSK